MKYGLLKLESLSPWKLILLTSPQGHGSDMLILFCDVCALCFFVWLLCTCVEELEDEAD